MLTDYPPTCLLQYLRSRVSSVEIRRDISLQPGRAGLLGQVRMFILLTFAAIAFLSDPMGSGQSLPGVVVNKEGTPASLFALGMGIKAASQS